MLGVQYDLAASPKTASIPPEKVAKTVDAIAVALDDPEACVSEDHVESLYGLLQHCASIMVKGAFHLPFSTVALKQAKRKKFAHVHKGWKSELQWWSQLLLKWNGVAMIVPLATLRPTSDAIVSPTTDAANSKKKLSGGAGAVFGHRFQHFRFTPEESSILTIMDLEALTCVLWLHTLCHVCPTEVMGKRFIMWCDNDAVVQAVQSNKSNIPTLAFFLEVLHDLQCRFSFELQLEWIDTKSNRLSDALSRDEIEVFKQEMTKRGYKSHSLVFVPIQQDRRSAWSSSMRQRRLIESALLPKPDAPTGPA